MTQDELRLAAEYDRGYHDGKAAYDADQWQVRHDRMEAANKLRELILLSDVSSENLSSIARCIYEPLVNWSRGACEMLRMRLIHLLNDAEVVSDYHYHYEPSTPRDLTYEALLDLLRDAAEDYKRLESEIWLKNAVLDIAIDMNKDMRRTLDGYEESHIELPKDKGGEYVHSGDVMFHTVLTYEGESNFIVGAISFDSDGAHVWDSRGYEVNADHIQHVKRDSAESIVRDLTLGNISESDAIARIEKLGSQHEQR